MSSTEVMKNITELIKEYEELKNTHSELKNTHTKLKRKLDETSTELDKLKKSREEYNSDLPSSLFTSTRWEYEKPRVEKIKCPASTYESRIKGRAIPVKYFVCLISKSYISRDCLVWYEGGWKLEYFPLKARIHKKILRYRCDWDCAPPLYRAFLKYLEKFKENIKYKPHRLPIVIWLEDFI